MARATSIINAKDGACSTDFTGSLRLFHVSGKFLFRLAAKTLATLVYLAWICLPRDEDRSVADGLGVTEVHGGRMGQDS